VLSEPGPGAWCKAERSRGSRQRRPARSRRRSGRSARRKAGSDRQVRAGSGCRASVSRRPVRQAAFPGPRPAKRQTAEAARTSSARQTSRAATRAVRRSRARGKTTSASDQGPEDKQGQPGQLEHGHPSGSLRQPRASQVMTAAAAANSTGQGDRSPVPWSGCAAPRPGTRCPRPGPWAGRPGRPHPPRAIKGGQPGIGRGQEPGIGRVQAQSGGKGPALARMRGTIRTVEGPGQPQAGQGQAGIQDFDQRREHLDFRRIGRGRTGQEAVQPVDRGGGIPAGWPTRRAGRAQPWGARATAAVSCPGWGPWPHLRSAWKKRPRKTAGKTYRAVSRAVTMPTTKMQR